MDSKIIYSTQVRMRKGFKILLYLVFAVIIVAVMRTVLNPYGDRDWVEISHGNHSHYVPKGWDGTNLGNFPTQPPQPNEIILPDGRVVAR